MRDPNGRDARDAGPSLPFLEGRRRLASLQLDALAARPGHRHADRVWRLRRTVRDLDRRISLLRAS